MRGGYRLTLLGLICGISLGFGIVALKNMLGRELMGFLGRQFEASCPCTLRYDRVEVSLLTLSATGSNLRVIENGEPVLFFKKGYIGFRPGPWAAKRIYMDVELGEGGSKGVGSRSAIYRFIKHVVKNKPKPSDPPRWRLKLRSLAVSDSYATEEIGGRELRGEGISLALLRDIQDDFTLTPSIERLSLKTTSVTPTDSAREIALGSAVGNIYLDDGYVDFRQLNLNLNSSSLNFVGSFDGRDDNLVSGTLRSIVDLRDLHLPSVVSGAIRAEATLSGSTAAPRLNGTLSQVDGSPLSLVRKDERLLALQRLSGQFGLELRNGEPSFTLTQLSGSGEGVALVMNEPVIVSSSRSSGSATLNAASFGTSVFRAENSTVTISLDGSSRTLAPSLRARFGTASIAGAPVRNLSVTASSTPNHGYELIVGQGIEAASGPLTARGMLSVRDDGVINVDSFTVALSGLSFGSLKLRGDGAASGPLSIEELAGNFTFEADASTEQVQTLPLVGRVTAERGELRASIGDNRSPLSLSLRLPLLAGAKGTLLAYARRAELERYFPQLRCLNLDGSLTYSFPTREILDGEGLLTFGGIQFGCAPYVVTLEKGVTISLARGKLSLPPTRFVGEGSSIILKGDTSLNQGWDLSAAGTLQLHSLLSFAPSLDDLSGTLSTEATLRGTLLAPQFEGVAQIQNGALIAAAADISAEQISGTLRAKKEELQVDSLHGKLNEGSFNLHGILRPFNLSKSSLTLEASRILVVPDESATVVGSGLLKITGSARGAPLITGTVTLDNAEFQKNIDIAVILAALSRYLFSATEVRTVFPRLPRYELDIRATAADNIFVITNWAGAEMSADLHVGGTVAAPVLEGSMDAVSGWFSIKGRRFEITSGSLTFRPDRREPELSMISEASLRSARGDTVLVMLEASGPLTRPRLSLSSDQGLTEKELLELLTTGRAADQTLVNTVAQELQSRSQLIGDEEFSFAGFLKGLAKIDSLSLEPTFNTQTGMHEPTVIARKRLAQSLTLIGESSFGGSINESTLKGVYHLTPFSNLTAYAQSLSTRPNTALGLDLTHTVLAEQSKNLTIKAVGNKNLRLYELTAAARINENSRLTASDMPRIEQSVTSTYRERGFHTSSAHAQCVYIFVNPDQPGVCSELTLSVDEGPESLISGVRIEGDPLPPEINGAHFDKVPEHARAELRQRHRRERALLKALREANFLSARVSSRLEQTHGAEGAWDLVLSVHAGPRYEFDFFGNHQFSKDELLRTINLPRRRQPFGNNTINILVENIERKYRQNGFLYATIASQRTYDQTANRVKYTITIDEGAQIRVERTVFIGNEQLTAEAIRELIASTLSREEGRMVLSPRYAVQEELEGGVERLQKLYLDQGFPSAHIEFRIIPIGSSERVEIHYLIDEGVAVRAATISVTGYPQDIPLPEQVAGPYSIPFVNQYVSTLFSTLRRRGYLSPTLSSELKPDRSAITITVQPGMITTIGAISIEGNSNIQSESILPRLTLREGEPWNEENIESSRRILLGLGLFSRISIAAADGSADSAREDMVIKVTERPLNTLEIGGGANSEYGLHLFGEAVDRRLFSDGRALTFRLDSFYDPSLNEITQGIAAFRFSDPFSFIPGFTLNEDLRYQKLDLPTYEYDLNRVSLASSFYRSPEFGMSYSFGHTILQDNLDNVQPDAVLDESLDTGIVTLSFLTMGLALDRRDDQINPRDGYLLRLESKLASEALLSAANYAIVQARASLVKPVPFFERFSVAASLNAGEGWAFGASDELPITQRFYLGGRNTVRGFRENSLGPRGVNNSVIGGDVMLSHNLELRYRAREALSVHLFLDGGNVFLKEQDDTFNTFRYGAGVGARYLSPIGPIGFDLGSPLDRQQGEPSLRFHFNIGSDF